jgi:hypothetical protein
MVEGFEDLEFLERSASDGFSGRCVSAGDGVEPYTPDGVGRGVLGVKVLVCEERILLDQVLENVIANAPLTL